MISTGFDEHYKNKFWKVSIPPAVEPVSVDEIKIYAKIDSSEEDNLLADLIKTSRMKIEEYLSRALIEQTIEFYLDIWGSREVFLPAPPLISITSVVTLDEDDVETVYAASNYYVIGESIPGKIQIKRESSIPSNTVRDYGGYKITYKAGYGVAAANVPIQIRTAIKQLTTLMYEKRISEDEVPIEVVKDIRHMRNRYRI